MWYLECFKCERNIYSKRNTTLEGHARVPMSPEKYQLQQHMRTKQRSKSNLMITNRFT